MIWTSPCRRAPAGRGPRGLRHADGSPGMEVAGTEPEMLPRVLLFGPSGRRTFARYRGAISP